MKPREMIDLFLNFSCQGDQSIESLESRIEII